MNTRPLDHTFVREFSSLYDELELSPEEQFLFGEVSPKLQARGAYNLDEFLAVCDWKSTRTRSLVKRNSPELVSEVTRIAFASSEVLQIPILALLEGVGVPTASALLTVWRPSIYTITDRRVLDALPHLSHCLLARVSVSALKKSYSTYLDVMRSISRDLDCDLRSLDKALWTFDKTRSKLQRTDQLQSS